MSAHTEGALREVVWTRAVVESDRDILGGGLAVSHGVLAVTTGLGDIAALDARSGTLLWTRDVHLPLRSAPRMDGEVVFATTIDNQVFAFDLKTGRILWKHSGIRESAGVLGSAVPAVSSGVVVVPYSSGELYALKADTGRELWSDMLLLPSRTTSTLSLADIDGNPVVADGVVYAVGHSGMFAAIDLATGQHVWDRVISSTQTPWVAGDFLYVLTSDGQLACVMRQNGLVKWAVDVPESDGEWSGPVLASEKLLLASAAGDLLALSPYDGSVLGMYAIPEGVTMAPVLAGGVAYFVTRDAELVAVE